MGDRFVGSSCVCVCACACMRVCVRACVFRAFLTLRAVLSWVITRWDLGLKELFHVVFCEVFFGH